MRLAERVAVNEGEAYRVAEAIHAADLSTITHAKRVQVSDEGSVDELAEFVSAQFRAAQILVNTFGLAVVASMTELNYADWKQMVDVNLGGTYVTYRAFGRQMIDQKYGKIINFGSSASLGGVPGMVHYTAAKHGVLGLTRALAVEWEVQHQRKLYMSQRHHDTHDASGNDRKMAP
jgi:NAD(P)-dependent dehydrogenase (short-subunit alcohol dehydrogenase family)